MARKSPKFVATATPQPAVRTLATVSRDITEFRVHVRRMLESDVERATKATAELATSLVPQADKPHAQLFRLESALRWADGLSEVLQMARLALATLEGETAVAANTPDDAHPLVTALRWNVAEATKALLSNHDRPCSTSIAANCEAVARAQARSRFIERYAADVRYFDKLVAEAATFKNVEEVFLP